MRSRIRAGSILSTNVYIVTNHMQLFCVLLLRSRFFFFFLFTYKVSCQWRTEGGWGRHSLPLQQYSTFKLKTSCFVTFFYYELNKLCWVAVSWLCIPLHRLYLFFIGIGAPYVWGYIFHTYIFTEFAGAFLQQISNDLFSTILLKPSKNSFWPNLTATLVVTEFTVKIV